MQDAVQEGARSTPAPDTNGWDDRPSHTAPVASDLVGTTLRDTYRVLRRICVGGMGVVYEAEHIRLKRRVAIKALARHLSGTERMLERFYREADVVGRLRHPHIVNVFDFDVASTGQPYLVMELLDGDSLGKRMEQEGPMAVDDAVRIAGQIAAGLSSAHQIGIVHRDLKPENVTLIEGVDGRSFAKLLDFGISKLMGESSTSITGEHDIIGTPEYMAPEQAKGDCKNVDARADQFALAAILYEMLSGRVAFFASDPTEALRVVIEEEPRALAEIAPHVPPGVRRVIERALSKNPDDRFPMIREFAESLRRAMRVGVRPNSRPPLIKITAADAEVGADPWTSDITAFGLAPDAAETTQGSESACAAEVKALAEQARIAFELAVEITRGSSSRTPHGRHLLETAAEFLPRIAEARLGPLHRKITDVAPSSRIRPQSPTEAFAISRLEAGMTVEEAVDAMGMPRGRALALLASLAGREVIHLEPAA